MRVAVRKTQEHLAGRSAERRVIHLPESELAQD